jgi:cytochrome P450
MPVGHLRPYLRDRLAFFAGCLDESGAAVPCRLAGDGYVLNSAEDVKHVLVDNVSNYVKARRATGPRTDYPHPRSLLTSDGPEHRRKRRAMQTVFRRALVEALIERARANSDRLAESWTGGAEVEMHETMTALAQRNILETLLGSASDQRIAALAAASASRRRAFERIFFSLFPLPEYLPSRVNRDHRNATRRLRATIEEEIATRRSAPGRPDGDLLSKLLDATYDDGVALSDREVADEVLVISLTGYDSVSEALAWTLYLLARHPEADAALAAEALGNGDGVAARLPCATRVVKESLRLFPPTWLFVRVSRGDDRLPTGARVAPGTKLYLCPYVVHRNPRYWPEPGRFAPERFAPGVDHGRPRYAYFPFGGGPHVCIGETLALAQIVTVLTGLASRHRLTLSGADEVVPEGGLSLRPRGGLRMRALPRVR